MMFEGFIVYEFSDRFLLGLHCSFSFHHFLKLNFKSVGSVSVSVSVAKFIYNQIRSPKIAMTKELCATSPSQRE
jgi:hypothetical protein